MAPARGRSRAADAQLGGWGLAGAAIGVLVVLGVVAPFLSAGNESRAIIEDTDLWFWLVAPIAAVAGGLAASAGRAEGLGVAAGVGLTHFCFSGLALRQISMADGVSPFIGAWFWATAMGFTIFVLARALLLSGGDAGSVPAVFAWAGLAGASALVVGATRPPFDELGVWDYVWPGDGWIGIFNLALIGSPLLAGIWLALTRSRVALGALAGVSAWYFVIWIDSMSDDDRNFVFWPFVSDGLWLALGAAGTTTLVLIALGLRQR